MQAGITESVLLAAEVQVALVAGFGQWGGKRPAPNLTLTEEVGCDRTLH